MTQTKLIKNKFISIILARKESKQYLQYNKRYNLSVKSNLIMFKSNYSKLKIKIYSYFKESLYRRLNDKNNL